MSNQRRKRGKQSRQKHNERRFVSGVLRDCCFHDFETVYWQPGELLIEAKLKTALGCVPEYAVAFEYGEVLGSREVKH